MVFVVRSQFFSMDTCLSLITSVILVGSVSSSLSNQSTPVSQVEAPLVILRQRIKDVTKFSFADLVASILRFDFLDADKATNE